jgi:hypothetical protein
LTTAAKGPQRHPSLLVFSVSELWLSHHCIPVGTSARLLMPRWLILAGCRPM